MGWIEEGEMVERRGREGGEAEREAEREGGERVDR